MQLRAVRCQRHQSSSMSQKDFPFFLRSSIDHHAAGHSVDDSAPESEDSEDSIYSAGDDSSDATDGSEDNSDGSADTFAGIEREEKAHCTSHDVTKRGSVPVTGAVRLIRLCSESGILWQCGFDPCNFATEIHTDVRNHFLRVHLQAIMYGCKPHDRRSIISISSRKNAYSIQVLLNN